MRPSRTLMSVPLLAALALGSAGCSAGSRAPHPHLAASVGGVSLSLDDLDAATDAVCTVLTNDPSSQATSRGLEERSLVAFWVQAQSLVQSADQAPTAPPHDASAYRRGIPGWDDMSAEEQRMFTAFNELSNQADRVQRTGAKVDLSGSDIVVNPRFDIAPVGDGSDLAGLSVPIGDEAQALTGDSKPTPEQLASLPDDELCGRRPSTTDAPEGSQG